MLLEHSREMALISESGLQRYFGNAAVVYRKQLPATQHPESTDVFSKRAIEMLRESAAQIHWVDTHFCSHVGERPFLCKTRANTQGQCCQVQSNRQLYALPGHITWNELMPVDERAKPGTAARLNLEPAVRRYSRYHPSGPRSTLLLQRIAESTALTLQESLLKYLNHSVLLRLVAIVA